MTDDIRKLHQALLDSWNANDARAYAQFFVPDGHIVGFDGSMVDGRDAIEAHLRQIFGDHEVASYVAKVRGVDALGPGTALLRAVAGMVPPGEHDINPAANAVQSLLAVERDGEWRIALFQNTPAAFHGRPEAAEQLTEELTEVLRDR